MVLINQIISQIKNMKIVLVLIIIFLCQVNGFGEEKPKNIHGTSIILSGQIIDADNNEKLAGVRITCGNESNIIHSTLDGKFFIYIKNRSLLENTHIEFSQIGYGSKTILLNEIKSNSASLTIDLKSE